MQNNTTATYHFETFHVMVLTFVFTAVSGAFFLYYEYSHSTERKSQQQSIIVEEKPNIASGLDHIFSDLNLDAKAVYVYDTVRREALYEKEGETPLPLASLTKLLVALVALEHTEENVFINIKPEYLATEGDSGLIVGETWGFRDMLDFTLMTSSNDGAGVIAAVAGALDHSKNNSQTDKKRFIKLMNSYIYRLGLTQTYFLNETGLDTSSVLSGSYGSARDVALMVAHGVEKYPDAFSATRLETKNFYSVEGIRHPAENTNEFVNDIAGLVASKTGYTDLAGGNLAVAFDAGPYHTVVVVVLGSSKEGRFTDTLKLVRATYEYFAQENQT